MRRQRARPGQRWAPPAPARWAVAFWVVLAAPTLAAQDGDMSFQADHIVDEPGLHRVTLSGNVLIRYNDVEIRAARLVYDRAAGLLTAEARPDSTGGHVVRPEFVRGAERFTADKMVYDLRADRGRVWGGRAVSQDRYLIRGEDVLLDSLRNVFLRDISLTTCDKDHPHYGFLAGRLKALENDKAIARGVTFELGPVPLFWFPFYVFPLEKGRHSGVLTPGLGSSSRDGLVVSNLGYYFAPSDYFDATARSSLRERGGVLIDGLFAYAVKRRLSGNVDLSYGDYNTLLGSRTRSWRLGLNHYQRLSPDASLRASGNFTNDRTFDERNSGSLYNVLNRQLRSSLSLDRHWQKADRSLDGSLTLLRDLDAGRSDYRGFPRLSFRQGRRRLIGGKDLPSPSAGQAWYRAIYYGASADLDNAFTRGPVDSLETRDLSLGTSLSISSQHRPLGWLELTPSFSTGQRLSRSNHDSTTRTETYTGNLSTGTTLYGFFGPRLGRLRGIRHRLQPRLDFSYAQSAAVRGGSFGFDGKRQASGARRSLAMGLSNAFDAKTEDQQGRVDRFTLLSATTSAGIDFDARPGRVRPLRTSLSLKPGQRLDVRTDMTHTFYDGAGRFRRMPGLSHLSVTTSFRLRGGEGAPSSPQPSSFDGVSGPPSDFAFERDLSRDAPRAGEPWRLSLGHYYAQMRDPTRRISWVKLDAGFSLRRSWHFDYGVNLDLDDPAVTAQSMSLHRTLHCWEVRLSVTPNGYNKGFLFRINIRDIPQFGITHRQGRT